MDIFSASECAYYPWKVQLILIPTLLLLQCKDIHKCNELVGHNSCCYLWIHVEAFVCFRRYNGAFPKIISGRQKSGCIYQSCLVAWFNPLVDGTRLIDFKTVENSLKIWIWCKHIIIPSCSIPLYILAKSTVEHFNLFIFLWLIQNCKTDLDKHKNSMKKWHESI